MSDTWCYTEEEDSHWFKGEFPDNSEWYIFSTPWYTSTIQAYNLIHCCPEKQPNHFAIMFSETICKGCRTVIPESILLISKLMRG